MSHVVSTLLSDVAGECDDVLSVPHLSAASSNTECGRAWTQKTVLDAAPKAADPESPLLREFILQRVLPNLVPVLAAAGEMPLEKPTELADRIANYSGAGTAVASATVMTADTKARQSRIEDKIDRLAASITAIRISAPGLYHGSSRSRSCSH
ncbi:hypothetical protein HPB52_024222 [Rhipicephalus sanguineus]|uniref:Uncharacterized protein n=1 Tax=Rhipicephalus sanguineus TaxID=34632 RepID=A0A9D4YRE4_RHISA|nr:hypothetical protein HPB52_024222 [Rhipicephalus sanguineus]